MEDGLTYTLSDYDYELSNEPCPDCGERLYNIAIANGPDDYIMQYKCFDMLCGYRETE